MTSKRVGQWEKLVVGIGRHDPDKHGELVMQVRPSHYQSWKWMFRGDQVKHSARVWSTIEAAQDAADAYLLEQGYTFGTFVEVQHWVEVPDNWVDNFLRADLFFRDCCGPWLVDVQFADCNSSYLCFEQTQEVLSKVVSNKTALTQAVSAWSKGNPLPKGWHDVSKDVALKAYVEGVKRWGIDWTKLIDGNRRSIVLQLALFGEVRYV